MVGTSGRNDERCEPVTARIRIVPALANVMLSLIGLMLAAQPNLTAAQINGIIKATARPLPGGSYAWKNDCGFGVIDPEACIREARIVETRFGLKEKFK